MAKIEDYPIDGTIDGNEYLLASTPAGTRRIAYSKMVDTLKAEVTKAANNYVPPKSSTDSVNCTAVAGDIRKGKTAVVNNRVITGTADGASSIAVRANVSPTLENGYVQARGLSPAEECIISARSKLTISIPAEEFGDAGEYDVMEGKTFTSSNGVKKVGKRKTNVVSSEELPPIVIENQTNLNGSSGSNTIPGIVPDHTVKMGDTLSLATSTRGMENSYLYMDYTFTNSEYFEEGSTVRVTMPKNNLGDATAADVKVGKRFSSNAGLYLEGGHTEAEIRNPVYGTLTIGDVTNKVYNPADYGYDGYDRVITDFPEQDNKVMAQGMFTITADEAEAGTPIVKAIDGFPRTVTVVAEKVNNLASDDEDGAPLMMCVSALASPYNKVNAQVVVRSKSVDNGNLNFNAYETTTTGCFDASNRTVSAKSPQLAITVTNTGVYFKTAGTYAFRAGVAYRYFIN